MGYALAKRFFTDHIATIAAPSIWGAGLAQWVAYFLDPACDWLERRGASRTLATVTISVLFFLAVALTLVLVVPLVYLTCVAALQLLMLLLLTFSAMGLDVSVWALIWSPCWTWPRSSTA